MSSRRSFIASVLGSAAVLGLSSQLQAQTPPPMTGPPANLPTAIAMDAVDGEKLVVNINGRRAVVRLICNDAPEASVGDNTTECGFEESRQALLALVMDKTLLLESDEEDKDGKDRLWRHVWLVNPDGSDGGLLNEILLQQGWVTTQEEEKNTKYANRYVAAAQQAITNQTGLTSACQSFHQEIPRYGGHDAPAQAGEAISVDGITMSLDSYYYSFVDELGSAAKGGYKYLIVSVTMVNQRPDDKYNYSDNRFAAKDLTTTADYDDTFAFLTSPLGNGELSPTEYVTGQVAIEVQETATNVRVKYTVNGDKALYWLTPA
jgi:endonuclease YncB( thermonuclease family)